MTKEEAITRLENHLSTGMLSDTLQVAWQTMKTAVLAQQTNNTGSPKLADLLYDALQLCHDGDFDIGYNLINEVIGQLRAGA